MIRLLDARLGVLTDVRPGRRGLLRVRVNGPPADSGFDFADLRVLLVADTLTRAAELRGLQVVTVLAAAGLPGGQAAALEREASALNIHPPSAHAAPRRAEEFLGGPADVCVTRPAAGDGDSGGLITVGPVRDAPAALDREGGHHQDPLAVRLALMSSPYGQEADLSEPARASAAQTLSGWRDLVAEWAEAPSRPMPAGTGDMVRAAIEDDLDTAAALVALCRVGTDGSIPAGAKFETFSYADRLLGLDMVREIGRRRS